MKVAKPVRAAALIVAVSVGCTSGANRGRSLGDEYLGVGGGSTVPAMDASPAGDEVHPAGNRPPQPAVEGALSTPNSIGRTGAFYLPAGYNEGPLPLLVAYHGTGSSGNDMVGVFRSLAIARRFIVVAPDSRKSPTGDYTWQVGDAPGDVTEDYTHTLGCIDEVRARPGVQIDDARVLAAGFSGGGSSAPYIASNERMFHGYAVLHGGVIAGGIGDNVIAGWFSTGQDDTLRPPDLVQQSVDYMNQIGFTDVMFRTYPGGHSLSSQELEDVVAWWLSP